ncbi:unnamed protein product [Oncorhynchus mykiss]|uniref:Ion transport domain-containing protein n=1 Tax=Oncorhynchus mykiss TaxID=8022 RepID=A0A060W5S5_ONCMY|nr:unnamed protein product [Oncorhynchus mykiss]
MALHLVPPRERVRVDASLQVMARVQMKSYYRQAIIKRVQQLSDGFIQWEAFRRLFDELDKDRIKEHPPKPEYNSSLLQGLQLLFSHYYVTVVGNAVALANVMCICTILVLDSEKSMAERDDYYMEVINCFFILYYLMEMSLKILAFGWRGYLSYRNNIFDGLLTVCLLILQITIFATYRLPFPKWLVSSLRSYFSLNKYILYKEIVLKDGAHLYIQLQS